MVKRLGLWFINGLLVVTPVLGTYYLVSLIFTKIDSLGWSLLTALDQKFIPGIGFLVVVALLMLIGFLSQLFFIRPLIRHFEELVRRFPFIKSIYSVLKDTMNSLLGEKKSFDTVVLVDVGGTSKRLGFLTSREPLVNGGQKYYPVYIPQSLQFAGDLYWFAEEHIQYVDIPPDKAMKLIVSGAMASQG
jgi:uncharacterized membrane protein